MSYLGSWKINDYLTFCCNTHDPDTGVATDADTVPTYRIYEDETGTAIANGSMAKLDDANTTGFYSERIQLLATTGFEKGKQYTIYISATVDSDTGTMHHNFQVEAEVDANTISDKAGYGLADNAITAAKIAADAIGLSEIASAVIDAVNAQDPGAGAITFTYTLTSDVDSSAVTGASVWVTSDKAGTTVLASGTTNGSGQVVFYLDAGTVYVWRQKPGWNFTNPDTETVA